MKRRSLWAVFVSWFLCAVCVVPFFYVLVTAAIREGQVSFLSYYRVFLGQTEFLLRFWKSLGLSLCIAGAQVAVSTLAGYGFALRRGYKSLEGMNGDISGYALTLGELCAVAVLAIL